MQIEKIIAHVRKKPDDSWDVPQSLDSHLDGTAKRAEEFARSFDSAAWARACAIGHDIGKAPEAWQWYLKGKSGFSYDEEAHLESKSGNRMDHSTPGATMAEEVFGTGIGRILSYCVAGHHTGLPDWSGSQSSLSYRLNRAIADGVTERIPEAYRMRLAAAHPGSPPRKFETRGLDFSLWIRMLFSCLVDADFLDTEQYMQPDKGADRGEYLRLVQLIERLNRYLDNLVGKASRRGSSPVYRARQRVLSDCRSAARWEPGFFSLTVPTGGGKTLSSMAFAMEHAVTYGKERVIYVIPYTSIIEQNADVFRAALGVDQVIEHHSNLDEDDSTPRSRLAAENWDASVIVTTSVQFFESLFAAKPSRCRKLHNIANSVVVLDEAQLVPVEFLHPILEAMRLLREHYRTSFVFCTATQPVFEAQTGFTAFPGLPPGSVREIVQDVPDLYKELRRVEVEPVDVKTSRSWEEIASELSTIDRVLCVVSDRKSCRELFSLMPEGTYHLSALMCPQHRSDRIDEIKRKLDEDGPVRVVSTQLVEAGVDISFPVVYRSIAGLDSIAQAAGRCNRDGELCVDGRLGRVVVFVPPRKPPIGILRKASETAIRMLDRGVDDPIDHSVFGPYFAELYWKANSLDAKHIIPLLQPDTQSGLDIQFRSAAEAFRIVDDSRMRTILVPYGRGGQLIEFLRNGETARWLYRKLQRYTVNVYLNQFSMLLSRGSLDEVVTSVFVLKSHVEYNDDIGLLIDEMPDDPEAFMVI